MGIDLERLSDDLYNLRVASGDQAGVITRLQEQQAALQSQLAAIREATLGTQTGKGGIGAAPISNYIRNGDFSHSWDSYKRATPVADDARFECWEVYTHPVPSASQELKEDSVYSGALVANSYALPDPGRSDNPTLDPNWNRTAGYARLGTTRTLDFPLPSNVAFPGRVLYVMLIAARRSAQVSVPGRLYAGIWDNTAGQRNWISGDLFEIQAVVIGTPAATESTEYLVVLTSDYGRTITSAIKTINAPTDASFVSGRVYVKLSWPRFSGFIQADIYRKRGAVYQLLSQQSTVSEYFDQGDIRQVVGAYPDTDGTKQLAYSATRRGVLNDARIDMVDSSWSQVALAIQVPATYNQSNTSGKQWLRIGLDEACTGADAAHGLYVDLVGMAYTAGAFAHHPDDLKGLQQPIAAPYGSGQGGTGTGGGPTFPPDPGEGGLLCVMWNSMILTVDDKMRVVSRPVQDLLQHPEYRLLSVDGQALVPGEVELVQEGRVETIVRVRTVHGQQIRCSLSHRLITAFDDTVGIPVEKLKHGDPLVVFDQKKRLLSMSTVQIIRRDKKRTRVVRITMKQHSPQTYLAGDGGAASKILSHNAKLLIE